MKNEILTIIHNNSKYPNETQSGKLKNGFYFNSINTNGFHEANIFKTFEMFKKGQPNHSILLCSYFDYLYSLYADFKGQNLTETEWELLEKLSNNNKNTNKELAIQIFETHFINTEELNCKY
jgi:hypothetical protein